jgi:hypothetical protein
MKVPGGSAEMGQNGVPIITNAALNNYLNAWQGSPDQIAGANAQINVPVAEMLREGLPDLGIKPGYGVHYPVSVPINLVGNQGNGGGDGGGGGFGSSYGGWGGGGRGGGYDSYSNPWVDYLTKLGLFTWTTGGY